MKERNMNEVLLKKRASGSYTPWTIAPIAGTLYTPSILCAEEVRKYVTIPSSVKEIMLVFTPNRGVNAFKFTANSNLGNLMQPWVIAGTNRSTLYAQMDYLLTVQAARGNHYFRIEYAG